MAGDAWKRLAGPTLIEAIDYVIDELADRVAERIDTEPRPQIERVGFSPAEAAAALGMSESTVRSRIDDGTIRAGRIGGRVIIHRRELDRLLLGEDEPA